MSQGSTYEEKGPERCRSGAAARLRVQSGVQGPLGDGQALNATLYLPDHCEPSPAIFALTPYTADYHHDRIASLPAHGYPCLVAEVRGRGNSAGTFHPLHDAQDAYDVVEWLAAQPYCNGRVGMWGGSYLGYT